MKNLALVLFSILGLVACQRDQEWQSFGPSKKASFVVVFKSGTTDQEILRFLDQKLFVKTSATGHWHRPGVWAIVKISVEGHEGYSVDLVPSVSSEERRAIKDDIRASPVVLAVFEQVPPDRVKLGTSRTSQ
jgi:hypothetical protein